jgi:hypothetical protein
MKAMHSYHTHILVFGGALPWMKFRHDCISEDPLVDALNR